MSQESICDVEDRTSVPDTGSLNICSGTVEEVYLFIFDQEIKRNTGRADFQ
jgi:hypothetical protein